MGNSASGHCGCCKQASLGNEAEYTLGNFNLVNQQEVVPFGRSDDDSTESIGAGLDACDLSTSPRLLFPQDSEEIPAQSPQPFDVELVREGKHWKILGLFLRFDNPRHLVIEHIWKPSLISEWTEKLAGGNQIQIGDIIVEVNGESSDSRAMLRAVEPVDKGSIVKLRIVPSGLGGNTNDGETSILGGNDTRGQALKNSGLARPDTQRLRFI